MQGTSLTFRHRVQSGVDGLNNPIYGISDVTVDDCLVGPISEPASAREQQAIFQGRDQVRIHLPKAFDGDVSGSEVTYDSKVFSLDSDSVVLMAANTPTRWNRYFRAEFVSNYQASSDTGYYPIYWGTNANTSIDGTEVMELQNNESLTLLQISFEQDGNGEYLYFAYPTLFGVASVTVNGLKVTAWYISEVEIMGVDGLIDYYVYRSYYKQHGSQIEIALAQTP